MSSCPRTFKGNYWPDARSDIHSLGVVLWELSSGRPPMTHQSISNRMLGEANQKIGQISIVFMIDYVKNLSMEFSGFLSLSLSASYSQDSGFLSVDSSSYDDTGNNPPNYLLVNVNKEKILRTTRQGVMDEAWEEYEDCKFYVFYLKFVKLVD
ncbi:1754_t:CDS:2 [Ambispora gerdemannii]|uniref:1754_t:CDS:1 n=1 Tax=Ambispora gerdemannii TaxID=144530 RepID=A0A9N8UYB0_9GLOM|nr:1754_t:CDS:2 [Ambispora gerdemannii]